MIDFGCAAIIDDDEDQEYWTAQGKSGVWWARRLLEDEGKRESVGGYVPPSRFR